MYREVPSLEPDFARDLLKDEGNQGGEESKNISFYEERPEEL